MRRPKLKSALAAFVMLLLTEAVYMRRELLAGTSSLMGSDYEELHIRRITFAREALSGARHALPAWYPREALGSPFAANLQSFPWIPTRLFLLLFDPQVAFAAGVAIAAGLSALFTFLYCRRAGLSRIAAAAAGWTFACAGFFASRVMAGHLPLLEAYPALPLLMWLVDRALGKERIRKHRLDLAVLAVCTAFVVSAGHPQVPAYAVASALAYTAWREKGIGRLLRARVAAAMVFGAGLTMVIWVPMLELIGRSTRVLRLAAPDNDVVMPYSRLLALVVPGMQGWAEPVVLADKNPFTGYANNSYFWDTASYIGILPLLAIVGLLIECVLKKRLPVGRWRFLACLGIIAFLGSLPLANSLLHLLPGTFLRSPARLLYISGFCAAVALGAGIDAFRNAPFLRPWLKYVVMAVLLILHFADLWVFGHWFIQTYPRDNAAPEFQTILERDTGSNRIAEQREDDVFSYEDRFDDAGGFDSIFLARFDRGYLALAGLPSALNEQVIDASAVPARGLEALGVRFVITADERKDLELVAGAEDLNLYRVATPAPRAAFFAAAQTEFAGEQQIPNLFAANPANRLILESATATYFPAAPGAPMAQRQVVYSRPSNDQISLWVSDGGPGFVYVLEAWDPGWTATIDATEAPVLPANGFAMAVPVPTGQHTVVLRYDTPGRGRGLALTFASLTLLTGLIASAGSGSMRLGRSGRPVV